MNLNQQHPDHQETLRRLRAVTRRIEAFFGAQMERLTTAMTQVQNMQSEYESARRLAGDLQSQQGAWLREREFEMQRLELANDALAGSWKELDQQKRELATASMQARNVESRQVSTSAASHSSVATEVKTVKKAIPTEMDLFVMKQLQAQVKQHQRRKR